MIEGCYGYVYKTTNVVNNKFYIGVTVGKIKGYLGSGTILLKAIEKYGRKSFKQEILEYCLTKELLFEREVFWIKELDARNPDVGYNISLGGNGGDIVSNLSNKEEIYAKIAEKAKGRKLKIVSPLKGREFSEEHKKKLRVKRPWHSKILKGKPWSESRRKAEIERKQNIRK